MIHTKKKEGETLSAFVYRFNKKVMQAGVVKETKKRQFTTRGANKGKRRIAALYRLKKQEDLARLKKYGHQ